VALVKGGDTASYKKLVASYSCSRACVIAQRLRVAKAFLLSIPDAVKACRETVAGRSGEGFR